MRRLALEREFKALNFQLEAKYENLYKPIYENRAKIIDGSSEVTVDEVKDQLANLSITDTNITESEKGVPQFWLKCLKNTAQFGTIMNKKDEEVLSFLRDITCEFKENGSFTIIFHFNPNQYFDAPYLTREFILDNEKLTISRIVSSKIDWKSEDLNPTVEKKKKKIKKKKEVKTVVKLEEVPSFFSFFKDYDVSTTKKDKEEEDDEEEEEDEMDIIEEEYDLGLFIKEELIPYAIEYYLGIVKDYAGDEFGEEDEPEEPEEEEEKPKKKGHKK